VRLCKARRYRFANSDMDDLETQLKQARADGAREIVIATDGVFSMDGYIAKLKDIRTLADRYGALIMVDDCHATGFLGPQGRGSYTHHGVEIDFLTGTFGKALGGAMGGFICATSEVIALLKQRARPYLFSNALAPAICGSSLEAIRIAGGDEGDVLRQQLFANAVRYRSAMTEAGFTLLPGEHPIIPVMLGDAKLAQDFAARALELGVYVIGFSFPVVPRGQARIRTQMSAAHTFEQIDHTVAAFTTAGRELGVI
jgi:glycine C-acetyltransferase